MHRLITRLTYFFYLHNNNNTNTNNNNKLNTYKTVLRHHQQNRQATMIQCQSRTDNSYRSLTKLPVCNRT